MSERSRQLDSELQNLEEKGNKLKKKIEARDALTKRMANSTDDERKK